jgi:GMP synthase (glutamine-hydrolysing)
MKPIIALRHVPHEGLGLLETVLREQGLVYRVLDLPQDAPRSFNPDQLAGLVVLGGPMNVEQTDRYPYLADEVRWIRQAVEADLPALGICLGSQLLAKALGSRVYANPVKEIGWYPVELTPEAANDALFHDAAPVETVFQWHGDTFDLPDGATLLATAPACRHQAFRQGRSAYGLQFHIEVTADIIADWLHEPGNCGELAGLDYIDPEQIRRESPKNLPAMEALGRRVLGRWASLCRARAAN